VKSEDGDNELDKLEISALSFDRSRRHPLNAAPSILVEETDEASQQISSEDNHLEETEKDEASRDSSDMQDDEELPEMQHVDTVPISEDVQPPATQNWTRPKDEVSSDRAVGPHLPMIPEVPMKPSPMDLNAYTDKDARKIAEKEQKRAMKVYQQMIKDRDVAIKDRQKLVEKMEEKARHHEQKLAKAELKQKAKQEKGEARAGERQAAKLANQGKQEDKTKKDRKFCMLPDTFGGYSDKCWVRVYMEGVDEVGAHCGLFFPGPHYENLVGDVGARVEQWVNEDATMKAIIVAEAGD